MFSELRDQYQRWAARRMFARWSPIYEEEVADNHYSAADRVAAAAIPLLHGLNNPSIADIGIGTGLLAEQLKAALPCTVSGLDFSEDMMAACVQKGACDRIAKCDVGRDIWPLKPASQDMVVSAGLLEYLTPPMLDHFMAQSAAILRTAGIIVFTYMPRKEHERPVRFWRGHSGTYLIAGYLPKDIVRAVTEAGFVISHHAPDFKGCIFQDGSSYPYRLIVAQTTSK